MIPTHTHTHAIHHGHLVTDTSENSLKSHDVTYLAEYLEELFIFKMLTVIQVPSSSSKH